MNKESIEKRRNLVRYIVIQNAKEGKIVSPHELLQPLKEAGFDVSEITIYRDLSKFYVFGDSSSFIPNSPEQQSFKNLLEQIVSILDFAKDMQESGIKKGDNVSRYSQILIMNHKKINRKLRGLRLR